MVASRLVVGRPDPFGVAQLLVCRAYSVEVPAGQCEQRAVGLAPRNVRGRRVVIIVHRGIEQSSRIHPPLHLGERPGDRRVACE